MRMDISKYCTKVFIFQLVFLLTLNRITVSDTVFKKIGMIEVITQYQRISLGDFIFQLSRTESSGIFL